MPIGWYIVPYVREIGSYLPGPSRQCAMNIYTDTIYSAGGWWAETEVLGNRAIAKVRATTTVLTTLNGVAGFKRLPKDRLDDSLADLPLAVKQALKDELLDMGYTGTEIQDRLGEDLGAHTLRDVLKFMTTRRLKPRYDSGEDEIIVDGAIQLCRSVESVDLEVVE